MALTEFYCQTTASNLNAGSTTNDNAVYTGVGDSNGTSVFTPSDGSTPASTVSVGDFASVYVTAGATVAVFIGRVTIVAAGVNGAITVSTSAKSGTFPASSAGAHTITCKVGGAWAGPNSTVSFPFGFITSGPTNVAGNQIRVNLKNNNTYSITAAMTHANQVTRFEGYTGSAGDGGQAIIDGGATGTAYTLLTLSAVDSGIKNLIFANNGNSGNAAGVLMSGGRSIAENCVFHDLRGFGLTHSANNNIVSECEAYACNGSNTASQGGFGSPQFVTFIRCISHDNVGSNSSGFVTSQLTPFYSCIADTNGAHGFTASGNVAFMAVNCDAYNNTGSGISSSVGGAHYIANSNFVKNTAWGIILGVSATVPEGAVVNCGFGVGTQVNGSGTTSGLGAVAESGSINYASGVTPWVDPANGDFRINLAAAKGAGRGAFTQTAASYAGTIGYPDIGAAQHLEGSKETSSAFA